MQVQIFGECNQLWYKFILYTKRLIIYLQMMLSVGDCDCKKCDLKIESPYSSVVVQTFYFTAPNSHMTPHQVQKIKWVHPR